METFEFLLIAPIPVGHRVEITWHGEKKLSWKGKISADPAKRANAVIKDLNTGVVYGTLDFYLRATSYNTEDGRPLEAEPLPELGVAGRVTGRVAACRVLTGTYQGKVSAVQTTLTVEPDAPQYVPQS